MGPSQLPLPSLLLMLTTDMVVMDIWDMPTMDTDMPPGMDMDMDTVMDTDMPTMDTTARGPLMLSPLLSLLLMLITDTELMAMDTDIYGHGYAHHGYAGYPYAHRAYGYGY